jgi:hypothetical protein
MRAADPWIRFAIRKFIAGANRFEIEASWSHPVSVAARRPERCLFVRQAWSAGRVVAYSDV